MRKVNDGKCCSPRTLPRPLTIHKQRLAPLPNTVHHLTECRHLTMQGEGLYFVNKLAERKRSMQSPQTASMYTKQHLQVVVGKLQHWEVSHASDRLLDMLEYIATFLFLRKVLLCN